MGIGSTTDGIGAGSGGTLGSGVGDGDAFVTVPTYFGAAKGCGATPVRAPSMKAFQTLAG